MYHIALIFRTSQHLKKIWTPRFFKNGPMDFHPEFAEFWIFRGPYNGHIDLSFKKQGQTRTYPVA